MIPFDIASIRQDFPILNQEIKGNSLVYLDNAATSQNPSAVLEATTEYYHTYNSNIHRGTHYLSQLATERYEDARKTIASYLNVSPEETIFTSGTTDSINTIAHILGLGGRVTQNDTILISHLEHHSNIVPWQMLAERTGAKISIIPVLEDGTLDQEAYGALLNDSVKIVAFTHVSNAFGTVNPAKEMIKKAHEAGALVILDGAQSAPHGALDLKELDCDFYVFSGHKVYAPTGIGILYGKKTLLEELPPHKGGGEMIREVTFEKTTYNDLPFKYEAGTPNIEGAIALAAAIRYFTQFDKTAVNAHEKALMKAGAEVVTAIPGARLYGPEDRIASLSFGIEGIHHFDLGTLLDQMGIAVRTGHHCCQPLMTRFSITGTTRASFAFYNTMDDVERFGKALDKAVTMLK